MEEISKYISDGAEESNAQMGNSTAMDNEFDLQDHLPGPLTQEYFSNSKIHNPAKRKLSGCKARELGNELLDHTSTSGDFSEVSEEKHSEQHARQGSHHSEELELHSEDEMQLEHEQKNQLFLEKVVVTFLKTLKIDSANYKPLTSARKATFQRLLQGVLSQEDYLKVQDKLESGANLDLEEMGINLKIVKKPEAIYKQVMSVACKLIKENLKGTKKMDGIQDVKSLDKDRLEKLFCKEYLNIPDASAETRDITFSYNVGVTSGFISAITLGEKEFKYLKEIIRVVHNGDAVRSYEKRIEVQVKTTLSKQDSPFSSVVKTRTVETMPVKSYVTKPKIPTPLKEFQRYCKEFLKNLEKICKALGIKEKVFGDLLKEGETSNYLSVGDGTGRTETPVPQKPRVKRSYKPKSGSTKVKKASPKSKAKKLEKNNLGTRQKKERLKANSTGEYHRISKLQANTKVVSLKSKKAKRNPP